MVDRREYLPYCPICGHFFLTSSHIYLLRCKHFFCQNCLLSLTTNSILTCPFDDLQSPPPTDCSFLGSTIEFLTNWIRETDKSQETTLNRLLEDIILLRLTLNFKGVPCRIKASGGACICNFKCPYDHTMQNYRTKRCGYAGCRNEECMFEHANQGNGRVVPVDSMVEMKTGGEGNRREKRTAVRTNASQCCELS